jgi:hypothetical protein
MCRAFYLKKKSEKEFGEQAGAGRGVMIMHWLELMALALLQHDTFAGLDNSI